VRLLGPCGRVGGDGVLRADRRLVRRPRAALGRASPHGGELGRACHQLRGLLPLRRAAGLPEHRLPDVGTRTGAMADVQAAWFHRPPQGRAGRDERDLGPRAALPPGGGHATGNPGDRGPDPGHLRAAVRDGGNDDHLLLFLRGANGPGPAGPQRLGGALRAAAAGDGAGGGHGSALPRGERVGGLHPGQPRSDKLPGGAGDQRRLATGAGGPVREPA